jgi:hypothetical protein
VGAPFDLKEVVRFDLQEVVRFPFARDSVRGLALGMGGSAVMTEFRSPTLSISALTGVVSPAAVLAMINYSSLVPAVPPAFPLARLGCNHNTAIRYPINHIRAR